MSSARLRAANSWTSAAACALLLACLVAPASAVVVPCSMPSAITISGANWASYKDCTHLTMGNVVVSIDFAGAITGNFSWGLEMVYGGLGTLNFVDVYATGFLMPNLTSITMTQLGVNTAGALKMVSVPNLHTANAAVQFTLGSSW